VKGLLERGVAVLAMDVRALGEGAVHDSHCASDAVLLGRPLLAQQAWDVLCAARYLKGRPDVAADRVALYAWGSVGLIATLAGALSDDTAAVAAYSFRKYSSHRGRPVSSGSTSQISYSSA
jgi:hypothetical protein